MEIVVSGIRSTGNLHLGNYFGAVKNFIQLQNSHQCYFFIANLHALTTHPSAVDMKTNVRSVLVEYLACGIDPEKCALYIQSDVPEISELYTIMNTLAYKGELEKVVTFKEKIKKHKENINAGLLTYPVLMAADILIHRAHKVPVGKDQEQHLEMTRNFANRFNNRYGVSLFPEPEAYNFNQKLVKVPGLDGAGKMGKSESAGNAVFLGEDPESIRKKVMRAKTDAGPTQPNQKKSEEIQNLFTLMQIVSTPDTLKHFNNTYNDCSIRYGDLKKQLAEDIINFTKPIREKILTLEKEEDFIKKTIKSGAEKARESASQTIKEVKEIMGLNG